VDFLARNLQKFIEAARKRPELTGVNTVFRAEVPQIYIDVDRDKVIKQGVQIGEVYQTLQAFLGGAYVNQFNRFGRQWKVYLQAEASERTSIANVGQFYVRNRDDNMVPLNAVLDPQSFAGPAYTTRFNLLRAAQVVGSPAPGYSSGEAMAVLEEVYRETMPREIGYSWADLSFQEKKASGSTMGVFVLSLVFVFLVLAGLYESWSLPFSVLLSVPIAVAGALLGLILRKFELDVYAQVGLVMIIGLSAKNAILIVEFAKMEFDKGKSLVDAALEGAKLRLRPILMTSFAFILGCVPLWIATGSGSASRRILGTSVIAGMGFSTCIAIFFVPLLFVEVEKLMGGKKKPAAASEPAATTGEGH
jgi:HAE1 family hydrophobic/amphiphilic exporter-1